MGELNLKNRRVISPWITKIKKHCLPYWEKEYPEFYRKLTKNQRRKNEK